MGPRWAPPKGARAFAFLGLRALQLLSLCVVYRCVPSRPTMPGMAQEPGVRRSGKPRREWNLVTGLPVKQERPERPVSDEPIAMRKPNWSAPRWLDVISGAAEDRKPHAAAVPVHTSVARVKQPMAHTADLIMSILTCGLWLPVWAIAAYAHSVSRGRNVTTYYQD